MGSDSKESQIKICRACHSAYKKMAQKFCGNGCERKEPFLINGQPNLNIEPREQIITPNSENKIRWMCVSCHTDYSAKDITNSSFICAQCKTPNDIIPFTSKACANCVNKDGTIHELLLEAKVCDLCSKSEFLLNNTKKVSELKSQKKPVNIDKSEANNWLGPEIMEFKIPPKETGKDTNQISLTLTILNNNLEVKLFAESKAFSCKELIRLAPGYIPESIYERLLQLYPKEILDIQFKEGAFHLQSPLELNFAELDLKFQKKGPSVKWDANQHNPLPESKLLEFKTDFLKFLIWVY